MHQFRNLPFDELQESGVANPGVAMAVTSARCRASDTNRYSGRSGDFVLVVRCLSCGSFEPDSLDECIKVIDDSVVDAVELSSPLVSDSGVGADGVKKTRGERGVDALE